MGEHESNVTKTRLRNMIKRHEMAEIWDCFFPSEKVGSGPLENRRTRNGTNVMIISSSIYDSCVRITGKGSAADLMEWT